MAARQRNRYLISDEGGAAAVEFALILPIFLMFAATVLVYGIYFGAQHSMAQLAADAARASVAGLTDDERSRIAIEHVQRSAGEYVLIDPVRVSITAAAPSDDARLFRVVLNYDASTLPIWAFQGLIPMPPATIVRSAVVAHNGS